MHVRTRRRLQEHTMSPGAAQGSSSSVPPASIRSSIRSPIRTTRDTCTSPGRARNPVRTGTFPEVERSESTAGFPSAWRPTAAEISQGAAAVRGGRAVLGATRKQQGKKPSAVTTTLQLSPVRGRRDSGSGRAKAVKQQAGRSASSGRHGGRRQRTEPTDSSYAGVGNSLDPSAAEYEPTQDLRHDGAGLPRTRFVGPVLPRFQCGVCRQVPHPDGVVQLPCRHLMCGGCMIRATTGEGDYSIVCGLCGVAYATRTQVLEVIPSLRQLLDALPVRCVRG